MDCYYIYCCCKVVRFQSSVPASVFDPLVFSSNQKKGVSGLLCLGSVRTIRSFLAIVLVQDTIVSVHQKRDTPTHDSQATRQLLNLKILSLSYTMLISDLGQYFQPSKFCRPAPIRTHKVDSTIQGSPPLPSFSTSPPSSLPYPTMSLTLRRVFPSQPPHQSPAKQMTKNTRQPMGMFRHETSALSNPLPMI